MAGVPAAPDPNVSEVNRIYSLPAGKGDIQLSWQIIDFHATLARPAPILPTQAVFINQVNNIFALCAPQNYTADARYARVTTYKRNVMQNRAETVIRKIREAIFVIADMAPDNTEPQYFDRNHIFTVTANSRVMHPPAWAEIDAPLGLAAFNAYLAALPNPRPNAPLRYVAPSRAELIAQRQRRLAAIAEEIADSPARIENVDHGLGLVPVPIPAVIDTTAGDGNCFWYAVSEAMYGRWGYFAEIKANIRWWFMAVLNDPTHVRYRTYVAMQHDSVYILPRRFLQGDRVETSLARCLHWNEGRHEEWRPRHNLALLQIVADYYDIEFLEFSLPMYYTPPGPPGPPTQMHFPRVRGTAGRPQVCIYMEYNIHSAALWQPLGPPAPVPFPTTAVLSQRVETMPWYVPGVQGYTPASMPVTLGPGTGQNDPFMVAPKIEEYLVLGRRNHPDLMPILPTPAVVAGWNNQLPGPGANLRLGWEDWMAADGSPINQDRKAVKGPDGRTLIGILHLRRKRPKKVVRDRSYRGRR